MKRFVPVLILTVSLFLASCSPVQNAPVSTQAPGNTSAPSKSSESAGTASTSNANTDTGNMTRIDNQGAVTVEITPLNLDQPGDTLEFDVAMNTHSVDLSMDLATLATLTTDTGLTLQPAKWDAPSGGHHADGKLSFRAFQAGKSILEGTKQLTLTITGIDNATRTFTWDLSTK